MRTSLILPKLLIDQQVNDLIDRDITSGPAFLTFDFQGYKQIINDQRIAVQNIKQKIKIFSGICVLVNISLMIWGFYDGTIKDWGMLASIVGSIVVLFYSLGSISVTINSVKNAFPNEGFVWINVWNLIIQSVLMFINFTLRLICNT